MRLIGFRALIDKDEEVLLSQIRDARHFFPGFSVIVAACGDRPSSMVLDVCDDVLYYGEKPRGFTYPWSLLVKYAQDCGAGELILCDGDEQFIFSELRRAYDSAGECDAVIPVRRKKPLFFSDTCIDRVLMEECENMLFRAACPNMLKDPQPGALILRTRKAISCIDLEAAPSWIGDIVATSELIKSGCLIKEIEIDVRDQAKTNVTLERELLKIMQMERYFGERLLDVISDKARYAKVRRCYEDYLHDRPCG
jgi:hypothetical protein